MKDLIALLEIPATDFYRSVQFYETLFGIKLTVCGDSEEEKMAFFPDKRIAISHAPDFPPSKNGVLVSLCVADMDTALATINANGGVTLRPKTKIEAEGMGYFALFADSEGNSLGLYSDR